MAGCGEQLEEEDAAVVVVVENEAESMPVQEEEEEEKESGFNHLDTCPVCHANFHCREPKLLPCLHSFCRKCLPSPSRNLAMTDPPHSQNHSAPKPLNVIRCPVCRQECMEVDVMDNVFVKDSAESPSSTVEKTTQLCMTCDDNTEAAGFCVDCVEYLCVTCVEAHQRVKFTKDHIIRQKTGATKDVHSISTQRPMFCDVHKQEPLKLFCETCDLLTCRDCQLVKHKDHNYQFLEDAYKNHKQQMENMTHQLQVKKKQIEEVENSINNGLLLVVQNRTAVHDEIKNSICNLILEINKKGKILLHQLEAVTKDHESVLQKQQEDIGYLSRHLDHVINFTKWATARSEGTALLYCKRLIVFQIGNLLRAKCSASFIPQSTVRFQCRASYWTSNVDLGSLVVENVPGHQLGGFQGSPHQLPHPGPGASSSPHSFALGGPHSTLAQLQMQVDKLNPQARWQPQPPPPPWTWYQSVRLPRTVPHQSAGPPSHSAPPQPDRRLMVPPPNHVSPTSSLPNSGFSPQHHVRGLGSSSSCQAKPMNVFPSSPVYSHVPPPSMNVSLSQSHPAMEASYVNRMNDSAGLVYVVKPSYPQDLLPSQNRNVQGQQMPPGRAAVSQEEKLGTACWKPEETHQGNSAVSSAAKRRRRSSPGPVIVIKDEPDDDALDVSACQRASLPDSTNDQPKLTSSHGEEKKVLTPRCHSGPPSSPRDHSKTASSNQGEEQQVDPTGAGPEVSNEVSCAVCHVGGELFRCHKCHRLFHLTCHVPTLLKSPSGEWFCSFCRDLLVPEIDYDCKPEARTVKKEPVFEEGMPAMDKRRCERLLLHLFCSELGLDFREPASPSVCASRRLTIKGPMDLSSVKKRLESKQSPCYQSAAEFVSDIRLIFGNCAALSEATADISTTRIKLKELFEEKLKVVFPEQSCTEIKLEMMPPLDFQLSSLDNITQFSKRQHICSDSQDKTIHPSGHEGVA